jgi:hypothetical protein
MSNYGTAVTFFVILLVILVTGVLYMTLTPLWDTFFAIGAASGMDPNMLQVMEDSIKTWLPMTIVMGLIVYGWRRSKYRGE